MALEIDAKNAAATGDAAATGATGKAKAKQTKNNNNNVPAAGEKNLVNGGSAATKKKGALTMTFTIKAPTPTLSFYSLPLCHVRLKTVNSALTAIASA